MKKFIQSLVCSFQYAGFSMQNLVSKLQYAVRSFQYEVKNTINYILSTATCKLPSVYCKLPTASRLLLTVFFFLCIQLANAQRFPVQVTQSILPPYSTKLNDYATASAVKLRLNLLLTDVVANNKQVHLKLRIQGNGLDIRSVDFVDGAAPIYLNGGVLQQFTNIELASYFLPNNLRGITPQQYNKPLPEGLYTFCWEVYDTFTNQQLNHPTAGCTNVYLLLNDPPFLNLPYAGDQIVAQDPMNIIFQWTPRHTNATNVSYEFELRELWDTQIDPQAAFLASPNYYTETTHSTTLLYNIGKPPLLPNKTYAWRVKAKSTTGVSENSVFKNDGYSEIYYFTHSSACYPPSFVLSESLGKDRVKITWQGLPDHKKYHVQYKRSDIADAQWFEVYTYNNQAQISNLRAGKTYTFRVGGSCNELNDFNPLYSYSTTNQFTMPSKNEMGSSYTCGIVPEIQINNTDPLQSIGINETFTAGDFPVTIKQVEGGNGRFTGVGYIVVPYLADTKIAVTFEAITINSDYQLTSGVVRTTYDPTWSNVENTNNLTQGGVGDSEAHAVDFEVADVQVNTNGDILVIGKDGEVVEYAGGEDTVITDSSGQVWSVDEEGNISNQGSQAEGGPSTPKNTNGVNNQGEATAVTAKGVIVTFTKDTNSIYGFDGYDKKYKATKDLYKKLGDDYYIPYKAVAKGNTETIIANLNITDPKIKAKDIVFKTKNGIAITKIDSTATSYTLELKGIFNDAEVETQALVKQKNKYEVAGAFIQYQAVLKSVNVVLVNTTNSNTNKIKEKLRSIYKKAMVNLTITEINDFKDDLQALASNDIIQSGESGFAAQYTKQQRTINNRLKQHSKYQQDAYYLILTDKQPSSANEKGFMPLGRQFGYIYTAKCSTANCISITAAHELGHGAFQLKHPFSTHSYKYAKEATNWLMDTKEGVKLPFVHWQTLHNPKLRIGIFDGDEEGEYETDGHYSTVYLVCLMLGMEDSKANELARFTEHPDTDISVENHKAELNYSWSNGEEQIRTHALTNGFHSDLELITAFEFMNSADNTLEELGRLLHRYGDTYAHSRLENFNNFGDPMVALDSIRMYGEPIATMSENVKANIAEKLYGGRPITLEHFSVEGLAPDLISRRPNWYIEYVKNLAMLISLKFNLPDRKYYDFINNKISLFRGLAYYAKDNNVSLIGIINYEIAKWKYDNISNDKKTLVFYIPFAKGHFTVQDRDIHNQHMINTKKYLENKKGITSSNYVIINYFGSADGSEGFKFVFKK